MATAASGIFVNYSISSHCFVSFGVYTVSGERVALFEFGAQFPGEYNIKIAIRGIQSGLYLYRFQAGDYQESNLLRIIKF